MNFKNKRILIISPEAWGTNMLSKHHYALELATLGNQVFFLNPSKSKQLRVSVDKHATINNLSLVNYSSYVKGLTKLPYWVTDIFVWLDIFRIERACKGSFDVVWNFDMFRFHNVKLFNAKLSILHPVDFTKTRLELRSAYYYALILSVSKTILERFKTINKNAFFINHGVSSCFLQNHYTMKNILHGRIRCGYVGNLLSFAIHYDNLIEIVSSNPNVDFHFIGPYTNSNLGEYRTDEIFISKLSAYKNVTLHGPLLPERVSDLIQEFEMFLICYHPERVGNVVSNNHKTLEYLSTGKVVVSSYTSTYNETANGLFEMVTNSADLPKRFKEVSSNIAHYNTDELMKQRRAFALDNSYINQLHRIERLINTHVNT